MKWECIKNWVLKHKSISVVLTIIGILFGTSFFIHIINIQSYPFVGDPWTTNFSVVGRGDLKIIPFNNTFFGEDIDFTSLKCGDNIIMPSVITDEYILFESYYCFSESHFVVDVLSSGKHTLMFDFGGSVAYAYNNASIKEEKIITYTSSTETHCEKGRCYKINYNDTEFSYDGKQKKWNKLNKAELKSTEYWNDKGFDKLDVIVDASKPQMKLWTWDREDFLDVELQASHTEKKSMIDNKLVQEYDIFDVNLYPLWNVSENGGFEFEIVFKEKPLSNKLLFNINYSDLEFYYQSPLYLENGFSEPNATCNATDCEGSHRPENVVGSYAVYHSSKSNNKYKTGKAFHIYRPLIMDANNDTVWGELNIIKNTLEITIDDKWLDTAKYPVIIDPSFGKTSIGGTWLTAPAVEVIVGSYYPITEAGTADSMSWYGYLVTANEKTKCGIYLQSDNSFVNETIERTDFGQFDFDWHTHNFSDGPNLIASTNYWLVVWSEITGVSGLAIKYDSNTNESGGGDAENYGVFPDPWVPSLVNRSYSIYANYTVTAPTDTCSCPSPAGNWRINMPDHCNITTNCNINGYNLSFENGTSTDKVNCSAMVIIDNLFINTTGIIFTDNNCYFNMT